MSLARFAFWLVVAFAAPAVAHHSVSGQFDATSRVELTGVISQIDWINPHTYIHLEVTHDDGSKTVWQLESLPTAMLRKAGLTSAMIQSDGDVVTARAIMARDGTPNLAWLQAIDYPDGRTYQFAGE